MSDQYCFQNAQGEYPILLSRVVMGKAAVCVDNRIVGKRIPPQGSHSVVGQQPGLKYREFVVYEKAQAYPEFLLWYRRANGRNIVMQDRAVSGGTGGKAVAVKVVELSEDGKGMKHLLRKVSIVQRQIPGTVTLLDAFVCVSKGYHVMPLARKWSLEQ